MSNKELAHNNISEESDRALKSGNQGAINRRLLLLIEAQYTQSIKIITEIEELKKHFAMWETPKGRFITWVGGLVVTALLGTYLVWVGSMIVKHERELGERPSTPLSFSR